MFDEFQVKAQSALEHFKDELKKVRTGRAQPSMVDSVVVEVVAYGGARMRIHELATLTAPDPSMLMIQPFDPSVTQDIERAIVVANLGFSPSVDQHTIRIMVPPLTAERREQMKKVVSQKVEEAKVALRGVRAEIKEKIEAQESISEDEIKRELQQLEKGMESMTAQIEKLKQEKEAELVQI